MRIKLMIMYAPNEGNKMEGLTHMYNKWTMSYKWNSYMILLRKI